jgi:hypothetical protein
MLCFLVVAISFQSKGRTEPGLALDLTWPRPKTTQRHESGKMRTSLETTYGPQSDIIFYFFVRPMGFNGKDDLSLALAWPWPGLCLALADGNSVAPSQRPNEHRSGDHMLARLHTQAYRTAYMPWPNRIYRLRRNAKHTTKQPATARPLDCHRQELKIHHSDAERQIAASDNTVR